MREQDNAEDRSDEALVDEARRAPDGDLRAFEQLARRYQQRVTTNCRYLTRSPEDAQDLAQEVMVKAFFGLTGFAGTAKFSTWLNRIKVNHCLNYLKGREHRRVVSVDDPGVEAAQEMRVAPEGEAAVHSRDQRTGIRETLDSLPETLRLPLILRELDGLSYQEIAEMLGVGLSAVKMRIKRARAEFRVRFSAQQAGEETAR